MKSRKKSIYPLLAAPRESVPKHHPLSPEGDTLAVLDACVLLPPRLSDVLFDLYLEGLYLPYWTRKIEDEFLIRQDHRWDYDEERYQLLGKIEQRVFFVVYTVRNSVIRIISARKANRREVKDYENSARQG